MEIGERGELVQSPYEGEVFFQQTVDVEGGPESEVSERSALGNEGCDCMDMKFLQQELTCLGDITTLVDDGEFFEMSKKNGLGGSWSVADVSSIDVVRSLQICFYSFFGLG